MDQRTLVDVVCKSGLENLAGEIGALLGQDLTCSDIQLNLTSKEDLFSAPDREKSALTRMSVSGDRDGHCYLLARLSSAAVLGGTLIMLPEEMIEEHAQSGKLDGELSDAFGEIANIIAGVFTQAFVDKYSKNLRFIKNTVEDLAPTKIDIDSDEPFAPGNYYVASCTMSVGDRGLGPLEFIVPAAVFELEAGPTEAEDKTPASEPEQSEEPLAQETARADDPAAEVREEVAAAAAPAKPTFADAKKLIDGVFNTTIGLASEEVGALLGQTLKCDGIQLVMTSKKDFFSDHCLEKSVLTHLKVTGDKEGLGFLLVQVPDAVVLGGTLIMLPEDQIAEQKSSGEFDGEVADSFGEIANILSGSLTQVFQEHYPKPLSFTKTDAETVVPTTIDPAAAEPFPEGSYYLASFAVHLEDHKLNRIQFIFPAELFDLDGSTAAEAEQTKSAETAAEEDNEIAPANVEGSDEAASSPATVPEPLGPPIVLLINDQESDTEPFTESLSAAGYDCRTLSFQDEIKDLFQQHQILGIFLVMTQVGEKGFAAAIKLQAAGRPLPPIIFAGPEWTKSAVIRAVKYGAKDILVLPASGEEIQDKVSLHIKKAS